MCRAFSIPLGSNDLKQPNIFKKTHTLMKTLAPIVFWGAEELSEICFLGYVMSFFLVGEGGKYGFAQSKALK